jgi:phosphatidylserine/phosphatidylglycerophosphate/cardiolipin synthase-like enzyme
MYTPAVAQSRCTVYITTAYFVPDRQFLQVLMDAARRGVDVRLVLPSESDHRVVLYAGRAQYTELLKAGVRIYERLNTILHAKTAVVDGVWSTVGSTNLEMWSFIYNDELNAIVLGTDFAKNMEEGRELAEKAVKAASEDGHLWFCYPKGTSKKYKSNIKRETSWELFSPFEFEPVSQVAINDDWSAMRFRQVDNIKTMKRKTAATEKGRERIKSSEEVSE